MTRVLVALAVAAAVASVVACGGEKAKPFTTPTVGVTATAAVGATPTVQVRHTGIAEVDAIIDALLAGDAERIRPLIQFQQVACIGPTPGNLGAFFCATGEPEGTVHEALPAGQCEGYWIASDDASALARIVSRDSRAFAVARGPSASSYYVIFAHEGGTPARTVGTQMTIENGRLTMANFGCASTPEGFAANFQAGDFVLTPP